MLDLNKTIGLTLALALAAVLTGCQKLAVKPAYSPDGGTLALIKDGRLALHTSGADQTISADPPQDFAWSPDGRFIAWTSITRGEVQRKNRSRAKIGMTTWIRDVKKGTTVQTLSVGGPIAWLDGDLLAADYTPMKHNMVSIDPESGQIHSRVPTNGQVEEMHPASSAREVFVSFASDKKSVGNPYKRTWEVFDGLGFRELPGRQWKDPVALSSGETVFQSWPSSHKRNWDNWTSSQVNLIRWDGASFVQLATINVPKNPKDQASIPVLASAAAATPDLSRIIVRGSWLTGKQSDLQELGRIFGGKQDLDDDHPLPKNLQRHVDAIGKRVKFVPFNYLASRTGTGYRLQNLPTKLDGSEEVALNPSGEELAVVGKKGLQIVPLP